MKKKLVRLTEGDLHRIVENSVKRVINELNYETYGNAARKGYARGNLNYQRDNGVEDSREAFNNASNERIRASKFNDAARNSFNRDYGYDDGINSVEFGGDFNATNEFSPHAVGAKRDEFGLKRRYKHGSDDTFGRMTPEEFFDDENAANAYRRADDELRKR